MSVYFPDGGRDLIYVEIDGQWVEYAKSVPRPAVPACPDTPSNILHWAGYSCHSSQEITREPRHRVYYDPTDRPDLFIVKDGETPTLPLPVLDLNSHAEDPEPWLDPETGIRFSADQARTITKLLRYSPRKAEMTAWESAHAEASQAVGVIFTQVDKAVTLLVHMQAPEERFSMNESASLSLGERNGR